ncbi:hypothetical protein ELY33_14715 [Vreelandella andesensis]|uniref:Uncharacterized protein n=1 Tax=Vreelandella andesensis TaxID=447567 RepID=A0A433KGF2_9GAMM|nr:hypothetical protein [Halomonas andesensis]RUR27841.1 hypothetical protein ELY33_14715 [Halomonas andesensis]
MSQKVDLLVHIGPLREESETLLKHVNHVTLVAALSSLPERQQTLAKTLPALHLAEQPVTPPGGEAVCYAYTLKDFNSLAPASELTSLYPGLGNARQQSVDTQTLPQALAQAGLSQATLTHLIIEQPEIALSLLQAFNHAGLLNQLTHLWVRTSPLRLYEGMATTDELTQWCEQHGFEVAAQEAEDPDFFLLGFARNPLYTQLKDAQSQLAEAQQQITEKDATISQFSQQLATLQQSNERFGQLESKLESLFGEQRSYIQQTTSALGQHVTRSARQQRDEQALTHYLQYGQRPVSTQLAPGYAMALLEHYDTHRHDVVVIFGSGNTTELLAQSIINARAEQPRLIKQNGQHQEAHHEVTLSHDDLPQTIVSLQHQKTASDELKERLNNKRLSHAVNVVYAPWWECQANDQTALFYAADTTLQRLNQWLPEDARVLVIVGETLPEAGHSREVALPQLLKQLPTQRLDIVLEGNSYPQESELTTCWNTLLETRQRPSQWLILPNAHSLRIEG